MSIGTMGITFAVMYPTLLAIVILLDVTNTGESADPLYDPLGWVAVFASVASYGCYGIYMKTPKVSESGVHPLIWQFYMSMGVGMATCIPATYNKHLDFSVWGFVGGAIFFVAMAFAYLAVQKVGFALGPAIWGGVSIVVSFIWGVGIFQEQPKSLPLSIFAVFVLVVGICTAASAESKTATQSLRKAVSSIMPSVVHPKNEEYTQLLIDRSASEEKIEKKGVYIGILYAISMGLINGGLMCPVHFFAKEQHHDEANIDQSISFIPCFSMGVVGVSIAVVLPFVIFSKCFGKEQINLHLYDVGPYGLITGLFWGCGYIHQTYATVILGTSVGFPLTQTCILVNGMWGIFLYREIRGFALINYLLGVFIVLSGVVLLALFGADN